MEVLEAQVVRVEDGFNSSGAPATPDGQQAEEPMAGEEE
jgi:hypothetical protein